MASSDSIKCHAQAVILCGLCDKKTPKWRCTDCDMHICEVCKNIHLKVPVAAKHEVVSLETKLQDIQKKVIIDNIPCSDHPTKNACLFCNTCDALVCSDCVVCKHEGHSFISIEMVVSKKLDRMKHYKSKIIKNLIEDCRSKTQDIGEVRMRYNSMADKSVEGIKQQEFKMTEAIRKYSKSLQDQVEGERSKMENVVCTIEQQVQKVQENLEDMKDKIKNALASNQGKVIFGVNIMMPKFKFDSLSNEIQHFIAGPGISNQINQLFGLLQTRKISCEQSTIKFKVCKTFMTDLDVIGKVCAIDEDLVWILNTDKDLVKAMSVNHHNEMTTLKEMSINCRDISRNSDNDNLISTKSGVELMSNNGEIRNILTLAPLSSHGIHTNDQDIMVGVKEPGNRYTPTDKSRRAVIVYGMDGQQKNWYEFDQNSMRLFTWPYRVTTNKNNRDILVIDRLSDYKGRIVCLGKGGGLKWTFEGNSQINDVKPFNPRGVVTTLMGHVLVTDVNNHSIHVLSAEGDILACKLMADIGIINPYSLDIDKKGQLWIGCNKEKTQSGAKLHLVEIHFN